MARSGSWIRFLSILGFGTLEGDEREAQEYLGQRIALYFQVLWVMYLIRYTGVLLLGTIRGTTWQDLTSTTRVIHLVATGFAFAASILASRPRRTSAQLHLLDAGGTLVEGLMHALAFANIPSVQRTVDLTFVVVLTHTLVVRAAVVPSSALRTLAIGCANLAMLTIGGYFNGLANRSSSGIPAWIWVYRMLEWGGISVLMTAVISQVIYGLRRRVAQIARLGQYTLTEKLGEGGMGVVYKASHGMLRRPTAIKLLQPERAGAQALQRFEREVQITATLVHPNTVAIYDFGRTPDGLFYYAMEYLDGVDLDHLVRFDGPQHPGRVVHILKQVCAALGEAHARGLIHRDVKPANVVLCERGGYSDFAKVVDFGLVKDLSPSGDATRSVVQSLVGTPLYLAPEVFSGRELDERSDLYSLGALAYFLLTSQPVFRGETLVEICAKHLHVPVVPPSEISPNGVPAQLQAIVLACLEKQPERRPSSAEALVTALEAVQDTPVWSPADARTWWAERGPAARRSIRPEEAEGASRMLAIDLRAPRALEPG